MGNRSEHICGNYGYSGVFGLSYNATKCCDHTLSPECVAAVLHTEPSCLRRCSLPGRTSKHELQIAKSFRFHGGSSTTQFNYLCETMCLGQPGKIFKILRKF